jgi:hypothetical protein
MQARILSLVAASAILAATTVAMAQQNVQTQPAENAASFDYLLKIEGVDGESSPPPPPPPPPPQNAPTAEQGVTSGGAQATDGLMVLRYLFGAQPQPPATDATTRPEGDTGTPTAEQGVLSPEMREAALLVPAVQKVREAAGRLPPPPPQAAGRSNGGVVVLSGSSPPAASAPAEVAAPAQPLMPELPICGHCGADTAIGSANGGVWKTTDSAPASETPADVATRGQGVVPEQPACGHCGADILSAPAAAEAEERPRRRRFSLSIGGVTLSSDGGVAVAVGDVNGDSHGGNARRDNSSARQPARSSASRPR